VATRKGSPQGSSNFSHNTRPNLAQYTSERPELISPWHAVARECGTKAARREIKEGQNNKKKLKNEKNKHYIRNNSAGA
jgi:hypothetical protein